MLDISVKTFDQLSLEELYFLLQLRSEVFVVEQDCVYQDVDGKDQKALHVIGKKDTSIIA
jgi:ElaA protein